MKNKTAHFQVTRTSTSTGFDNLRGEKEKPVDVDALVSSASRPEKRLGHMPISWMLSEIRKVFPNAKIL
jgi:hypothetical protein